jgi:hypothetical protein
MLACYAYAKEAVPMVCTTCAIGVHDTIEQVWQQVHPDRVAARMHLLPLLLWQMVGEIQHDHPWI